VAWVETESLSFTARHDDGDTACAQRILDNLEELRLRLDERFDETPDDVTVVIHDNPAWLSAAHPLLPPVRWSQAPAGRRYLAGWPMQGEIHVLSDQWMDRRAGGEDSSRALRGTADRMYCFLVLAANNDRLPPMWTPRRFIRYMRWAWLMEGAAQYFSGQVSLFRPAVITRLREGERPKFPPSRRDAVILGGTVFDLLDRHAGPRACSILASRLHREGAQGNLELAFEASMREIEKAWRQHLDEIVYPDMDADPLADTGEKPAPFAEKASPLRRPPREEAVDLHDLELRPEGGEESDFDPNFEDPFEGEPRIRRGSGLRSPVDSELGPAPDLDFGPAPEFGFEGSGAGSVEDPDEDGPEQDRRAEPGREPGRRPNSRK
jgi:hypothetical protein